MNTTTIVSAAGDSSEEPAPIAANFVRCSGLEQRITECTFQEERSSRPFVLLEDLEDVRRLSLVGEPIQGECEDDTTLMLAVVCRQFPIVGAHLVADFLHHIDIKIIHM